MTQPAAPAWREWLKGNGWPQVLLVSVVVVIVFVLAGQVWDAMHPYPECDDPRSLQALAMLYDNKRLLKATGVHSPRLVHDGFKGRFCLATVTWSDGSTREVSYGFSPAGRGGHHAGWTNYNK